MSIIDSNRLVGLWNICGIYQVNWFIDIGSHVITCSVIFVLGI